MTRPSWFPTAIAVGGVITSLWLYRANRALHDELDAQPHAAVAADTRVADTAGADSQLAARLPNLSRAARLPPVPPILAAPPEDLRLDKRTRRLVEFTGIFGRKDGESEADYRARIGPLLTAGLALPRIKEGELRKQAEAKAAVTPEQAHALDHAFEKTYSDVLDYANKSVADGALSPYSHDMAGWLEFAGGLGGILNDSQGAIGQILSPDQMKAMSASGFDWGEYLSTQAPWENLSAPPPPKP